MKLFEKITDFVSQLDVTSVNEERKQILQPLIDFIQSKQDKNEVINLNFICTHNSRRSHLTQIWAQTMANFYALNNVRTFSGGTEATACYPAVIETLANNGFEIQKLVEQENPIYALKNAENSLPIIAFSKRWDNAFNPKSGFCAIMTCSQADGDCPVVFGAEKRVPVHYIDPKVYDNAPEKMEEYNKTSVQIATEMKYVFGQIKQSK
ncbi:arsenate-mycothiol transferase ArsC [Brumimicrobium aurantiacum]|uniref:Protein-tyrosine-phosphatase n=1 Tax=Brumimicrobium aurantiacum TaxID=1737063 RepID=A0A3E1F1T6_9FLAO|nr:protein-tyrosine-phosphatase [Brumimicrobium aurantiacum]RFC55677.1 protein-tyrosine-phosphatase [Brumimicrobium aurantiacum]